MLHVWSFSLYYRIRVVYLPETEPEAPEFQEIDNTNAIILRKTKHEEPELML